jgi:hypothetical protein
MATTHSLVTLSDSEGTRLSPAGLHSGVDITIQNVDESAYVYIGGEDVTTSDYGYRLMPNSAISFELPGRDALYAVSDTDESQVAVLKTNLEAGN